MSHLLQPSLSVQVTDPNCSWHPVLRWVFAFIQGKHGKRQIWIEFKYGLSEILQSWNILYQDCSWCWSLLQISPEHPTRSGTRCHLIHGSLGAKDEEFLMGLATADGCRKYGAALLRRILLCAIWESRVFGKCSEHICVQGASAWWTPGTWGVEHPFGILRTSRVPREVLDVQVLTSMLSWSGEMQILGPLLADLPKWVKADLGPHQPKAAELQYAGLCISQTT